MHDPNGAQPAAPIDLATLGWATASRRLDPAEHDLDQLDPARVLRVDATRLLVSLGDGEPPLHVLDRTGTDQPACVGDWVLVEPPGAEGALRRAIAQLPRAGSIGRRRDGGDGGTQTLAANVDLAIVVESIAPQPPNIGRVRRLLVLAAAGGADPLLVLTKCDLHPAGEEVARVLERDLAGLVPAGSVLLASADDGTGTAELAARLPRGCTAVLVGASGAGKSTLANRLLGREAQATGHVRGQTGTGRHVTSAGQLLVLPGGGLLVDTPGIRGIGMHHDVDPAALVSAELTELAATCRFADCTHDLEPGCVVQVAIAEGRLPEGAVVEWQTLLRELEREAAKHDARLRAERSRRMRRQGRDYARFQRANPKGRPG